MENDYKAFCKSKLFHGLNEKALQAIYSSSREISLEKGEILIQEGEEASELFIIIEGSLEVVKREPGEKNSCLIDTLNDGDTVGELAFFDRGFRSASVIAKSKSLIRGISFKALEDFFNKSLDFSDIYLFLSKNVSQKLRNANKTILDIFRARINMGIFIIYITAALCFFAYSLKIMDYLIGVVSNTTYIVLPMTAIFGVLLLTMMKLSHLSWGQFGITLANWRKAVFEGFVFPIPTLILGIFIKWALVNLEPGFVGDKVFDPFSMILDPADRNWGYWVGLNSIYLFFTVPIQELLVRGGVQGLLEQFLIGKHRVLLSILISNLIFSTVHIFLGIQISIVILIGGIYMGWIYSRTHNLISSCIAHAIMGIMTLSILGITIKAAQ